MKSKVNSRRLWRRILPFPIGTRVRVVRETISKKSKTMNFPYLGREGTILKYSGMGDKKFLVSQKAFPRTVLKEIMYIVILDKDSTELIFRNNELEAIDE